MPRNTPDSPLSPLLLPLLLACQGTGSENATLFLGLHGSYELPLDASAWIYTAQDLDAPTCGAMPADWSGDGQPDMALGWKGEHAVGLVGVEGPFAQETTGDGATGPSVDLPVTAPSSPYCTSAGDVDGDGYDDLLVGAPVSEPTGLAYQGTVALFRGPLTDRTAEDPDTVINGDAILQYLGRVMDGGQDVDGDHLDDILLVPDNTEAYGFVFTGGPANMTELAAAEVQILGPDGRHGSAEAMVDDVDGDGLAEVVGRDGRGDGTDDPFAWLARGPLEGTVALEDQTWWTMDNVSSLGAGVDFRGGGDLDGDGLGDLILAAPGTGDSRGSLYALRGPAAGGDLSTASFQLEGAHDYDQLGLGAVALGDLDGDGKGELAVSDYDGNRWVDVVRVYPGGLEGVVGTDAAVARIDVAGEATRIDPESLNGGDLNGDGWPDLAILGSAPVHTADGSRQHRGAVFVLFSGAVGEVPAR